MPLSPKFREGGIADWAYRLGRLPPALGYILAIAAVAAASALRWAFAQYSIELQPFLTYYPAVVVAAFFGGVGPGIAALAVATLAAWFIEFAPEYSVELYLTDAPINLVLFVLFSGLAVALVGALHVAIEAALVQHRNVRLLTESAPNGLIVVDQAGAIRSANPAAEKMFGYEKGELTGKRLEALVPAALGLREDFEGATKELKGRCKDDREFHLEISFIPISSPNGPVLASVLDISERKRAEERQQLLIHELNHRSQNLFSVIQSIAGRTLREGTSKRAFIARMSALAKVQVLLTQRAYEGVRLHELLAQEVSAFGEAVEIKGCDLLLSPQAAQSFALIVHELTTNAAKYGALALSGGRVTIDCWLKSGEATGQLSFSWVERGGLPLAQQKSKKGFGSSLLINVPKNLGGEAILELDNAGLSYSLLVPTESIQTGGQGLPSSA